jgi:broad specificity polyphosphatase/5'/3'-nucleotidase SurE
VWFAASWISLTDAPKGSWTKVLGNVLVRVPAKVLARVLARVLGKKLAKIMVQVPVKGQTTVRGKVLSLRLTRRTCFRLPRRRGRTGSYVFCGTATDTMRRST